MWGLEAKAFSGPLINFVDDLSHVLIAEIINVFSLWDVLPDQTVGVFCWLRWTIRTFNQANSIGTRFCKVNARTHNLEIRCRNQEL